MSKVFTLIVFLLKNNSFVIGHGVMPTVRDSISFHSQSKIPSVISFA